MRHLHADLIHAWADGAEIEYFNEHSNEWRTFVNEHNIWYEAWQYRIKPEPKPDIVKYINVRLQYKDTGICRWDSCDAQYANLKLVFDGDTGNLKSAEAINESEGH
jgi:hypothetical protein